MSEHEVHARTWRTELFARWSDRTWAGPDFDTRAAAERWVQGNDDPVLVGARIVEADA